jgi:hypothetical protein
MREYITASKKPRSLQSLGNQYNQALGLGSITRQLQAHNAALGSDATGTVAIAHIEYIAVLF